MKSPFNITGFDEFQLKCDCFIGSVVISTREPLLYGFALDKPPGQKYIEHLE